jgi:hypothetical protein
MAVWLFAKALCKFWWALMSSAVFTGLGIYAAWQEKTNHWIVGASLLAGLNLFLVAAFLAWNEQHQQLEAELAKRQRPDVIVTCDWPSSSGGSKLGDLLKRNLFVQVLNEVAAIEVQIQDVTLEKSTARFSVVPLLRKDKSEQVRSTIERPNGSPVLTALAWNLETLVYESYKDKVKDISNAWTPPIPIIACYRDADGRNWQSVT